MTLASFELSNDWHGLGTVGHIVLAVVAVLVVAGLLAAWWRS